MYEQCHRGVTVSRFRLRTQLTNICVRGTVVRVLFVSDGATRQLFVSQSRRDGQQSILTGMTPLKAARLARGISQAELARRTGFTQSTVSYTERIGSRSGELYRRASAVLGVPVDELWPDAPTAE